MTPKSLHFNEDHEEFLSEIENRTFKTMPKRLQKQWKSNKTVLMN